MEKKTANKLPSRQSSTDRGSGSGYFVPPPSVLDDNNRQGNSLGFLVGLVSMALVFVLLLPVIGFMLLDITTARQECRYERQKMEQLYKQLKEEK